jgi:tetratricopeptide (TPR) repeat protein
MVGAGDESSRTLLYYANELRDDSQHQAALATYARYLDDPGAGWEVYTARVSMSGCARRLGRRDDALSHALAAMALEPSRAEAPLAAGQIFFDEGDWTRAAPFFAAACAAVRPSIGFIAEQDYTWRPWDFLAVCLANTGRHEDAIAAATRSVQRGNPDVQRVQANLGWSLEQLAKPTD